MKNIGVGQLRQLTGCSFKVLLALEKLVRSELAGQRRGRSKRRVRIEHVFARLKTFHILRDQFPLHPSRYTLIFHAIATIHNIIMEM